MYKTFGLNRKRCRFHIFLRNLSLDSTEPFSRLYRTFFFTLRNLWLHSTKPLTCLYETFLSTLRNLFLNSTKPFTSLYETFNLTLQNVSLDSTKLKMILQQMALHLGIPLVPVRLRKLQYSFFNFSTHLEAFFTLGNYFGIPWRTDFHSLKSVFTVQKYHIQSQLSKLGWG